MLAGNDEHGARYPDYDRYAFYRDDVTGRLLSGYGKAFLQAPACRVEEPATLPASPFVSIVRPRARSALGWLASTTE
jgi:hypothetical protein